ncbi:MAG TPA: LUD domain-containing protein, partial [Desulfosarcina sp.]|nr:LUD domain-containing protein [Desulfosarcina sp.]
MDNPVDHYWSIRLKTLKKALEANNFDVYLADNKDLAKKMAYETIIPAMAPKTVSWGGSMT